MVEAMFERSPNYFKQFQKQFKFLILEEKPSFSIGNFYAVCTHFDSEFCNLVNSHYHLLIDTTTFENETLKRYQSVPVPFVYTAFKFVKYSEYSFQYSETLRRVETILYGPHSGAFCQIMDIFMSGYGKLNIDSDLLSVRFVYEEKVKFWKKINFSS